MEISTTSSYGNSTLGAYIQTYDKEIKTSLERLASGLRVSKPSDDSGSYFRAQTLDRRSERTLQVSREIETDLSRVKSAEGYLQTVSTFLDDLVGLAKEAKLESDDTLRGVLGEEFDEKVSALESFISNAKYEGEQILSGIYDSNSDAYAGSKLTVQVDEEVNDNYEYEILDTRVDSTQGLNLSSIANAEVNFEADINNVDTYLSALEEGDSGITRVNRNLNRIQTHRTILEGSQTSLQNKAANYQAASSALVGVDDAAESTRLSALQIRQQAAASFLAQSNVISNGIIGMLTGFQGSR